MHSPKFSRRTARTICTRGTGRPRPWDLTTRWRQSSNAPPSARRRAEDMRARRRHWPVLQLSRPIRQSEAPGSSRRPNWPLRRARAEPLGHYWKTRERSSTDPLLVSDVNQLRGGLELGSGSGFVAHDIFMSAAEEVAELDHERAATLLLEATRAAIYTGDLSAQVRTGRRAQDLRRRASENFELTVSAGMGLLWEGDGAVGRMLLDEAIARAEHESSPLPLGRTLRLAAGRRDDCARLLAAGGRARPARGRCDRPCDQPFAARPGRDPGRSIPVGPGERCGRAWPCKPDGTHQPGVLLPRSCRLDCRAPRVSGRGAARNPGRASARANFGWKLDCRGRDAGARRIGAWARPLGGCSHPLPGRCHDGLSVPRRRSAPSLVLAAVRAGRPDVAAAALEKFEQWVARTGSRSQLALVARSRALLAEDDARSGQVRAGDATSCPDSEAVRAGEDGAALRRAPPASRSKAEGPSAPATGARALQPDGCGPLARAGRDRAAGKRRDSQAGRGDTLWIG